MANPLKDLLKTPPFLWGDEQRAAFESHKTTLGTAPVLALYDMSLEHNDDQELKITFTTNRPMVVKASRIWLRLGASARNPDRCHQQQQDPTLLRIMNVLRGDETSEDAAQLRVYYELHRSSTISPTQEPFSLGRSVRSSPAFVVRRTHDERGHFELEKTLEAVQESSRMYRVCLP